MKNTVKKAVLAAVAITALSGCAASTDMQQIERHTSAINAGMREIKGNLDEINFSLQSQNKNSQDMTAAITQVTASQAELGQKIKSLEDEIQIVKRNQADTNNKLAAGAGGDVKALSGQVEVLSHSLEETNARMDAMKAAIIQKLAEMDEASKARAVQPAQPDGSTGTPSPETGAQQPAQNNAQPGGGDAEPPAADNATATPQGDPNQMYQAAYLEYTKGNYDLAIMGFGEYLRQFPDAEFAGNAQYWIAESMYSLKKFDEALPEFDRVIANFPTSSKVPGAMLKKGYTLDNLKRGKEARDIYKALIEKFPGSEASKHAEDRLKKR